MEIADSTEALDVIHEREISAAGAILKTKLATDKTRVNLAFATVPSYQAVPGTLLNTLNVALTDRKTDILPT